MPTRSFTLNTILLLALFTVIAIASCAAPQLSRSQGVRYKDSGNGSSTDGQITETELQQDILRINSQFIERIVEAMTEISDTSVLWIRELSKVQLLLYASNALEIATGIDPAINLLD